MFKISLIAGLLLTTVVSHADLEHLTISEMNNVVGQGGADLSWTLSLNHHYATNMDKDNIFDDQGVYYYLG